MRLFMTLITLLFSMPLVAQSIADFENFDLEVDSFLNGSDPDIKFSSGRIMLENQYSEEFGSWSGFAISTMTDTLTPGFNNQYSSIAGRGAEGSQTYAVSYVLGSSSIYTSGMGKGREVEGCFITNTTFSYLSMANGDQFAKKFGGPSGDDPDFFRLKVEGFLNGELKEDSVIFYLADFRFDDNSMDYIVDSWSYVDLSPIGKVDSLWFSLASSDNGSFGMNTPAYFCIDEIETADLASSVRNIADLGVTAFPNPCVDHIELSGDFQGEYQMELTDMCGQRLKHGKVSPGAYIDLSLLPTGPYILRLRHAGQWYSLRITRL